MPWGLDGHGAPVSVQLVGKPFDEATLLSLSTQIERSRPWAGRRPPCRESALYVWAVTDGRAVTGGGVTGGGVTSGAEIEASGLLDGLTGEARAERAELDAWLLDQGITVGEIRDSYAPMLLPARRALGDDGTRVSARDISERTGVDLELLSRMQHAVGLPRVDDPDAAVYHRCRRRRGVAHPSVHRPQGWTRSTSCRPCGYSRRVVPRAETMRQGALAAVFRPGVTELEIGMGTKAWRVPPRRFSDR